MNGSRCVLPIARARQKKNRVNVIVDKVSPKEAGLSAVFVRPDGAMPKAGVIVIGGAEGGLHEPDAAALAYHGFAALALAYFGAPGVPPILKEIPLEYFFKAIDFLHAQGVERVGLAGGSRGGEASLLVASHDSRVAAVVSVVGSGVVTAGIDYSQGTLDRILSAEPVSWTLNGEPLPQLPYNVPADLADKVKARATVRLGDYFAPLPTDPAELERISIPVERSSAAILLIAGAEDRSWDSPAYHAVAAKRLEAANYPHTWGNFVFPGAGHMLAGPPRGAITSSTGPGPGITFDFGGDPAITTVARAETWQRTVAFFKEHLRS